MSDENILRVALVDGPMYDRLYQRIPQFESETGTRVDIAVRLNHPALNARMAADFAGGHDPGYDLISTHTKYAPSQREFLRPLDDLLNAELDPFSPAMLEHARIDGRLYGIPRNIDVKLLYYRTDLFDDAGNKEAYQNRYGQELRIPQTWDELWDTAVFFTRPPAMYGFVFPGSFSGLFGHFFELDAMAGGDLFGEGPSLNFQEEAARWALGLLTNLYQKGIVPHDVANWHYDEVTQFFVDGRAAMTTDWPGGYHLFKNPATSKVADRFGVALYPVGPSGKRFVYSGGHTFAIPRSVRNLERALSLLRFLTSGDSQYLEATLGALPARSEIQARIQAETPPGSLDSHRLDLLRITVENHMLIPPKFPEYPAVEDALWTSVRAAIVGEMDIDTALQQAAHQTWEILKNPDDR